MEPVLQVALDFENLSRALQVAKEAVEGGADWIEVGTPLIKSEGMQAIREIKRNFPNKIVVADMKTADVGGFETELAAKSGAQVVTILGISDDPTITEAVKAGKKYGAEIMIDLLQVENVEERVKQLEKLGVKYFCEHVGIDMQMIGKNPLKVLERVVSATKIPIAVAGGLNKQSIPDVIKRGASIIIVGGAITKAPNVTEETAAIKEGHCDWRCGTRRHVQEVFKGRDSRGALQGVFLQCFGRNAQGRGYSRNSIEESARHENRWKGFDRKDCQRRLGETS